MSPRKPLDTCDLSDLLITIDDLPRVRKRETGAMITHGGELMSALKQKGIVITKIDLTTLLRDSEPTKGGSYASGILILPAGIEKFISSVNERTMSIWDDAIGD